MGDSLVISTLFGDEILTKTCIKCGEEKSLADFVTRTAARKDDPNAERRNECKACASKESKIRRQLLKYQVKPDSDYSCPCCERTKEQLNKNGWVMDHDHATGEFRGWLCDDCNGALGKVFDNPDTLRRLANYLETPRVVVDVLGEFE